MKAKTALFLIALLAVAAAAKTSPLDAAQAAAGKILNNSSASGLPSSLPGQLLNNSTDATLKAAGALGFQLPQLNISGLLPTPPKVSLPVIELRTLIIFGVLASYIFAAGRIADFLQSSGRGISRKEALAAPAAYMLFSAFSVLLYFSSRYWVPPQNSLVTIGFYLLLVPLVITIGIGAIVLRAFFRDRLGPAQSIDLSIKIVFAPVFDGIKGYWAAMGAAAIVGGASALAFWLNGANFAAVPLDFFILSLVIAAYFLYRALTSQKSEDRASNAVTILVILAPSVLQMYFKELACAALAQLPFALFSTCPLKSVGSEVTLALSVSATLLLLVPAIPFVYAIMVNILRASSLVQVIARNGEPGHARKKPE